MSKTKKYLVLILLMCILLGLGALICWQTSVEKQKKINKVEYGNYTISEEKDSITKRNIISLKSNDYVIDFIFDQGKVEILSFSDTLGEFNYEYDISLSSKQYYFNPYTESICKTINEKENFGLKESGLICSDEDKEKHIRDIFSKEIKKMDITENELIDFIEHY